MNQYIKDRVVNKLRYGGYKQIKFNIIAPRTNRHYSYDALGVIGRAVGMSPKELMNVPNHTIIRDRAGLTKKQTEAIINRNDKGHSFAKIADYIETKF